MQCLSAATCNGVTRPGNIAAREDNVGRDSGRNDTHLDAFKIVARFRTETGKAACNVCATDCPTETLETVDKSQSIP